MIVVSDTSPIHYLILINAIDVLSSLFKEVVVPPTVAAELSHPKTPEPVRDWFQVPPSWIRIQAPRSVVPIAKLDPGEVEAIALALELDADRLLIDDNAGKIAAQRLGVAGIGTLAILDIAGRQQLLDFCSAVMELERSTNFRMPKTIRNQLFDEHQRLANQSDDS